MKSFACPLVSVKTLLLSLLLFNLSSECHSINQKTDFHHILFLKELIKWLILDESHSLPSLQTDSEGNRGCGNYCGHGKYDFHTIVPGFVLVIVSYFLLYLLNAAVTGGRRRRALVVSSAKNDQNLEGISNFMIS